MDEDHPAAGDAWYSDTEFATVREIEAAARGSLPTEVWNFLAGGAGDENTVRENRGAFARWQFLPRHVALEQEVDLTATLLGHPLPLPVFTAPFGFDRLFHADGLLAVARAQQSFGVPLVVSRSSAPSLEEIAEAAGACPLFLQVLPVGPVSAFEQLVVRASRSGFAGLVITVDGAAIGWRDRSREDRFRPNLSAAWGNYRGADGQIDQERLAVSEASRRPVWGWEEIGRRCDDVGLPWMPKGVLTPSEAKRAMGAGATGIYVSNHGGRALDDVPASLDALMTILAAEVLDDDTTVVVDGGARRAGDVAKAVALGADAVGVGRLVAFALAAGGESAVRCLFELLQDELRTIVTLLGRQRIDDLTQDCVQPKTAAAVGRRFPDDIK